MILYSFSFQFCSFVSVQICCKIKMHKKSFKKNNKRLSKNILASAWAFQELHKSLFLRHILNPFFINFSVKWMVMNKNKNLKKNVQLVATDVGCCRITEFKKNIDMMEFNMHVLQYIITIVKGYGFNLQQKDTPCFV